jgi:hypothetical protein
MPVTRSLMDKNRQICRTIECGKFLLHLTQLNIAARTQRSTSSGRFVFQGCGW